MVKRVRKSNFVRLFDKTPAEVVCPHFYELILSNRCPYNCLYCYLKLTFRGNKDPVLFTNEWHQVEKELNKYISGVFSTGELADSLAIIPPLLGSAINYFRNQEDKYLLMTTKSTNIDLLLNEEPSKQIIISFSVNTVDAWKNYELKTPHPYDRIYSAMRLKKAGWKIRIRIDPIIAEDDIGKYEELIKRINDLEPDLITIGSLRQYPGLYRFEKRVPGKGLSRSSDGRLRYPIIKRAEIYSAIANWLNKEPALCKETKPLWKLLGWRFKGCNCTVA